MKIVKLHEDDNEVQDQRIIGEIQITAQVAEEDHQLDTDELYDMDDVSIDMIHDAEEWFDQEKYKYDENMIKALGSDFVSFKLGDLNVSRSYVKFTAYAKPEAKDLEDQIYYAIKKVVGDIHDDIYDHDEDVLFYLGDETGADLDNVSIS